jgi:hypothetical protein
MKLRARIMTVSTLVIALGSVTALRPEEASARMCGVPNSCGVCCYGPPSSLPECCEQNSCSFCDFEVTGCCPGGYELVSCNR